MEMQMVATVNLTDLLLSELDTFLAHFSLRILTLDKSG